MIQAGELTVDRACMSDSMARSLATAIVSPSGSKLACATQLATCAVQESMFPSPHTSPALPHPHALF